MAADKAALSPTFMLSGAPVIVIFSTGTTAGCTVIVTDAFMPDPSAASAVTAALPAALASIAPFALTDTISGLLDDQISALLVAFSGNTTADNSAVSPISILSGASLI